MRPTLACADDPDLSRFTCKASKPVWAGLDHESAISTALPQLAGALRAPGSPRASRGNAGQGFARTRPWARSVLILTGGAFCRGDRATTTRNPLRDEGACGHAECRR